MNARARYRKKPVVIDAIQWTGDNFEEVRGFVGAPSLLQLVDERRVEFNVVKGSTRATIDVGDWVIAERDGAGFYPCVEAQFADTYEAVYTETREETQ